MNRPSPNPVQIHSATLYHGHCLEILPTLADSSIDAVVADPPYASGGATHSDVVRPPALKYCQAKQHTKWPNFLGDQLGPHAFTSFSLLWMREAYRLLREGGYILVFVDWRQLPAISDLVEMAGFIRRGIVVWDKTLGSRAPHTGYFRHQAEYLVWGTRGPCMKAVHGGPWPGVIREPVRQTDKFHMTGKPSPLLEQLVQAVPEQSTVLDPFMGSGTCGVACLRSNRQFVGMELSPEYFQIACQRMNATERAA